MYVCVPYNSHSFLAKSTHPGLRAGVRLVDAVTLAHSLGAGRTQGPSVEYPPKTLPAASTH